MNVPWERYPTNKYGWNTRRDLPVLLGMVMAAALFCLVMFTLALELRGCP